MKIHGGHGSLPPAADAHGDLQSQRKKTDDCVEAKDVASFVERRLKIHFYFKYLGKTCYKNRLYLIKLQIY